MSEHHRDPFAAAESGYTWCGCRDCFEIVIGPMDQPELCWDCHQAGCDIDAGECQRFDAYETAGGES